MKAYLNDPKLKERFLKEIKAHEKADSFLQGTYSKENGNFKGCAIGCSLESLNRINKKKGEYDLHKRYEKELGIPESIAWLEDKIFEGLPVEESKKWPYKFSSAIPVGADLSMVSTKFKLWLLRKDREVYKNAFDDGKKAIDMVVKVLKDYMKTGKWDDSAAYSARSAADSARSAADSAAYSACSAAYSAACYAAYSAADSAAYSAAYSARYKSYKTQAKKLLELLKEA